MLIIENLRAGYGSEKEILKGLSLSMETGMIHGFAGLNGAGKTTLLNTLYSFIRPSTGTILYQDAPLQRKDIGYLEAESYFYPYITGSEYLELFPSGTASFKLEDWSQLFQLPLYDITESYSTGMKKKLRLLAVLKMDKPILILDEPFNGLDLEGTHLLNILLLSLREKGKTILVTSHVYETLTSICDSIHYLQNGIITHSYPKNQFETLQQLLHSTIEQRTKHLINNLL